MTIPDVREQLCRGFASAFPVRVVRAGEKDDEIEVNSAVRVDTVKVSLRDCGLTTIRSEMLRDGRLVPAEVEALGEDAGRYILQMASGMNVPIDSFRHIVAFAWRYEGEKDGYHHFRLMAGIAADQ